MISVYGDGGDRTNRLKLPIYQ